MGAKCGKVSCCGLWVQRSNLGYCSLFQQSSGVGSREARLSSINGWQVRDERLTAYPLLYFTLLIIGMTQAPAGNVDSDLCFAELVWLRSNSALSMLALHAYRPAGGTQFPPPTELTTPAAIPASSQASLNNII